MGVSDQSTAASRAQSKLSFDVSNQQDVAKLLGYLRGSQLDQEERSHIRDLVLDFTHSQDEAVLAEINQLVAAINIEAVQKTSAQRNEASEPTAAVEPATSTASPHGFGYTRQAPAFGTTSVSMQMAPAEKPTVSPENDPPADTEKPEIPQTVKAEVETKTEPPPSLKNVPEPAPARPASSPADVPASASEPEANPVPLRNLEPQRRIQEIKKYVNERVGNPVNLIDSHNDIGREYMNALLDAMKKGNSGQAMDIKDAMARLEQAFEKVKFALADKSADTTTPPEEPANLPTEEVPPSPPEKIQPTPPTMPDLAPAADAKKEPVPSEEKPEKRPPVRIARETKPASDRPATKKTISLQDIQAAPQRAPVSSVPAHEPPPQTSSSAALETSAPPATEHTLHSLAESKADGPLHPLQRTKAATTPTPPEPTDPLERHEVTAGLEQLLSEWKLFKSSGIFGTGPSGREHPLYQKLAVLPMASVVAGRFEGATPEVRQSITDYLNGWRYEQGIVHDMSENFEHYLRRVIASILEKQPGKKAPS